MDIGTLLDGERLDDEIEKAHHPAAPVWTPALLADTCHGESTVSVVYKDGTMTRRCDTCGRLIGSLR